MRKIFLQTLPWIFIGIGFIITCVFLFSLSNSGYIFNTKNIELDDTVKVADFIGGIVGPLISAAGFFFLFLNLSDQRSSFHIERLESKFFEMIKFHRENINELKFTYFERDSDGKEVRYIAEKRKVFKLIHKQFEDLYNETNFLFEEKKVDDLYDTDYKNKLLQNQTVAERKIDLIIFAKLDILYLIIFFGVGLDGIQTVLQLTANKYKTDFINKVLSYIAFKPKKENKYWEEWLMFNKYSSIYKIEKYDYIIQQRKECETIIGVTTKRSLNFEEVLIFNQYSFDKYYGGHQFRLGHYFRNFFQAVRIINEDKKLNNKEKYDYVKVLRAQLSTLEQILFFLNSISQLGRVWELEKKGQPEKQIKVKNQLITKYNLIKNLPNSKLIDNITYSSFYPLVSFEVLNDENIKQKRKAWKKE